MSSQLNHRWQQRILRYSCILVLMTVFVHILNTAQADSNLPELGDPSARALSPQEEEKLGRAFLKAVRANVKLIEDELVLDYIQNLGLRLASNSPEVQKKFNFFILNAPTINAFAGPNANIGINSGLIQAAENESQLASVIAHEIAHVSQKHLNRAYQSSQKAGLTTLATVLAAIMISSADPNAGAALLFGGLAGNVQQQINFTRDNEFEADRVGISILDDTNINPRGMIEFFEILQTKSFYGGTNDIEYLRTHPLNATRIAEATTRASKTSLQKPFDSLNFRLAKARLNILLQDNPVDLVEKLTMIEKDRNLADYYELGLAFARLQQHQKAIDIFNELDKKSPHLWFKMALAVTYNDAGESHRAIQLLKELHLLYPDYLPVIHIYAEVLISNDRSDEAISILNRQLTRKKNSVTYKLLAQAYFIKKQMVNAFEATAEQYAMQGYYELAIQQLDNAIKLPDISIETIQRLEAKKRIFTAEFKID